MRLDVNGTGIEVEDRGDGTPVLLIHGWPDTHAMWNRQTEALNAAGYRTIAPDLRGFGASDKPPAVEQYALPVLFGDLLGVVDQLGIERIHVVGHDWGAALAWALGFLVPDRLLTLSVLSVGHPAAFFGAGMEQRERSWYMLLFQFEGVAEQWLTRNNWANFRAWSGHPAADEVAARLTDTAELTATLNPYRANLGPEALLADPVDVPAVPVPTMGVWSTGDRHLIEQQMQASQPYVSGSWRYERLDGVGHWMTLEAPDRVNALLLDFLGTATA
jgi:pimeloyl-ACP methyl ester carboxylesterase